MPTRTYQVNYDITANTLEAVKSFQNLVSPMSEVAQSAKLARESLTQIVETAQRLKSLCNNNFVLKPTINTKSFADALATMEANVKASSMRMRASLEAALAGSTKDHERINNLLGAGNWKKAVSEQSYEVKRLERNLDMLKNLKAKFSGGKSEAAEIARKRADEYFNAFQKSGVDMMKNAADHLRSAGLGNILFKDDKGWKMAAGDSKTKLKDYIANVESQYSEAQKDLKTAIAKNEKTFGSEVKNQTAFNRRGSFVERVLGVAPEQLGELQTVLNNINSMMGGAQKAQTQIQNVVKKNPIPKPLKPQGLPTMKEMGEMQKQITTMATSGLEWGHDKEIRSWERLERAGKIDSLGQKRLDQLRNQRAIWAKSQVDVSDNADIESLKAKYKANQKGWADFRKSVADWRAKPYTETVEQVATPIANVKDIASKPIEFNITGNFASQIEPLTKLTNAFATLPKAAVDIPVNVSISSGAVAGLEAMKQSLSGINTVRADIEKGDFKKLSQMADKVSKIKGGTTKKTDTKKKGVKPTDTTTKVGVDGSAATAELSAILKTLQEQAGKNTIVLKALFDGKALTSSLNTAVSELKSIATKASILVKSDIKVTGLSQKLRQKTSALKAQANKNKIVIGSKFDGVGLSEKLREKIKALKELAVKNPVPLKAKFDTKTISADLKKVLSGLKGTTIKNMPKIVVELDTTSAMARLKKLLLAIQAASPQTIKLGATASSPNNGKGGAAPTGGRGAAAPSSYQNPRRTTSSSYRTASNISNIAATTAAMRSAMPSKNQGFVDRLRKSMYPLTGNVSLGASTPVALDMAKGMGMMYGVGGAMNLITGGMTEAMEYQNTMETAEEILKKNYSGKNFQKDFGEMSKEVRRVAKQTKFTAPQAADATRFMAMAGLSIPMIKASVSPIADVAVIGDNDFGEVADKMTNIQTAFQIQPDRMRHVADAITNTFSRTNTDMMMLAESMQYAAPMAHLSGLSLEDTLAMVGIMGNSGIQASMAGTTLRMMLQNTLNPNKKQAALWKQLGVHTRDKDGNLRNMIDILSDVKVAAKGKYPMADVVSNLFRVTASAGAGALINNIDDVKALARQNKEVGNISGEISERKQNTVKGLWAQMTSSFTEANLKVFEQFQEDIKGMINAVKDYFNSREAVENLRQAFMLIKDIMSIFGTFVKIWSWLYNKIGFWIKLIIASQFALSQLGLLFKPIMSLVNALGGLKSMALGFVGALGSVGNLKKAAVAASMAGAVSGGVAAGNPATAVLNRPHSGYAAQMEALQNRYAAQNQILQNKKEFYDTKVTRLKNSVQAVGSKTGYRVALDPYWFVNSPYSDAQKGYWFRRSPYFMNHNFATQQKHIDMASARSVALGAEMAALRAKGMGEMKDLKDKRLEELRAFSKAKKPYQIQNRQLLNRYLEMATNSRENAIKNKLSGSEIAKRTQAIETATLMLAANPYSRAAMARRPRQKQNAELMYRAMRWRAIREGKQPGFWTGVGTAMRTGWRNGQSIQFASFFASLKTGFVSVLTSITKAVSVAVRMLISPISLAVIAITALGTAAILANKRIREQAEASRVLTKKLVDNINQTSNLGNVDYGGNALKTKFFDVQPTENTPSVKQRNKKYHVAWDNRLFKPNGKTGAIPNSEEGVNAWQSAFIEPNKAIFGKDYKLFTKEAMMPNTTKALKDIKSGLGKFAGLNAQQQLLATAKMKDLPEAQKSFQLSSLYIEGANSKKAADVRQKIIKLREQLSNGNIKEDKYAAAINDLLNKNGLTSDAINKIPRFTGNPNTLKNQADWSRFQQYHLGMYNQLMSELRGDQNTLGGYYNGIDELKSGVKQYSSQWWNAIRHIIGGMRTTVDEAGNAVQIRFDAKSGLVQWQNVIAQIRQFNKGFRDTMYNYLKLMGQAYGAMVDEGLTGNYFKDWRKFYIEQNKHRVVSENDARYYYSQRGYSGERLENEIKNGLWTQSGGAGGAERKRIRERLAIQRADEAKRAHDKAMQPIKDSKKALDKAASLGTSNSSGTYNSPVADAIKDTNSGFGNNRYKGATARPTQINISIDKLANFDKIQFLEGKNKDITMAIADATAEAVSNLVPMLNALVTNDKRADMI